MSLPARTRQRTAWPSRTRRCVSRPPMNPVAPVTRHSSSRERSTGSLAGGGRSLTGLTGASCARGGGASSWRCRARSRVPAGAALALGEHRVERAEEALRLALGERERRQQLDHVVLAGGHRDDAVVAVQRDHDQLREQPLAGHVDQAPVHARAAAAGRTQLDPDHQPAGADLLDHLVALAASSASPSRSTAPTRCGVARRRPSRSITRSVARPGRHRQAVASERRLMHVAALQRAHRPLVDLARGDHRRHRHVAAAERLADEHEVRLERPSCSSANQLPVRPEPRLDLVERRTACRSAGTAPARRAGSRAAAASPCAPGSARR